MKKKFLAYILLLILALSACGHTTENSIRPAKKVGTIILSVNPAAEDCGLKAINLTTINENIEDTEVTEDMELHQLYLPAEQTE
ncbi:MAG: hypothetical protein IJE27_05670 [Anaerotignum sp.]|nr:hypothetical protein [Anaerotignum sp.]